MCVAGIDFSTSGYFLNNFNMVFGRSLHDAATWEWFERITAEDGAKTFWDVGANVGLCGCTLISAAAFVPLESALKIGEVPSGFPRCAHASEERDEHR